MKKTIDRIEEILNEILEWMKIQVEINKSVEKRLNTMEKFFK